MKWVGVPESSNTWIPSKDVLDKEAIKKFENSLLSHFIPTTTTTTTATTTVSKSVNEFLIIRALEDNLCVCVCVCVSFRSVSIKTNYISISVVNIY